MRFHIQGLDMLSLTTENQRGPTCCHSTAAMAVKMARGQLRAACTAVGVKYVHLMIPGWEKASSSSLLCCAVGQEDGSVEGSQHAR